MKQAVVSIANDVIFVASLITAVMAIVAVVVKMYKFIRKWEKWVEQQSEHNFDNYMSVLQLKIMSPYMPMSERIKAGDIYVKLDGNGEVKAIYHQLLKELEDSDALI